MAAKRLTSPYAPPKPATARQSDAIEAVRALTRTLGHAPSATEVGARLGISRQAALKLLRMLASKGLVSDLPKMVSSGQWAVTEEE